MVVGKDGGGGGGHSQNVDTSKASYYASRGTPAPCQPSSSGPVHASSSGEVVPSAAPPRLNETRR